jgi:phospholipid transport system substrate-binding protein
MSSINLARRRLALAGAAVLAVSAFNTSAQVLVASPDGLIRAMSEDLIRVIKADRRLVEGDLDQLNAVVDERVMPSVDFSRMTALTVGIHWRRATPEQQRQLMAAFRELLLLTYADALRQVQNASVDVKPGRYPADADDVIVRTQVIRAGKEPIQLDYRLSKTAQGWKIYDFNVLGLWMVDHYRNQFGQLVTARGLDGLIAALDQKNKSLRAAMAGKRPPPSQ